MIAERNTLIALDGTAEIRTAIGRVAKASDDAGRTAQGVLDGALVVTQRNDELRRTVAQVAEDLLHSGHLAA